LRETARESRPAPAAFVHGAASLWPGGGPLPPLLAEVNWLDTLALVATSPPKPVDALPGNDVAGTTDPSAINRLPV